MILLELIAIKLFTLQYFQALKCIFFFFLGDKRNQDKIVNLNILELRIIFKIN